MSPRPVTSLPLAEFIALMACLTAIAALSIDSVLPALRFIGDDLQVQNPQQLHYTVSFFFIGLALGQLLFGPISDSLGRRYATIAGLLIFVAGSIICIFSSSITVFLAGRIIQGIGVGGPRISVMAIVRDQYEGEAMARIMSFIMAVFILVPMLAPLLGQVILIGFSWHFIFVLLLAFAAMLYFWFTFRQSETLSQENRRALSIRDILRSTGYILGSPNVLGYTLALGILFGMFLSYLSTSQSIFQDIYQTGDAFPFYFALLALAIGLASLTNGKLVMHLGMIRLCFVAVAMIFIFGLIFLLLCLFGQHKPPLVQFLFALFPIFFGIGLLMGNLNALAMEPLGERAGIGAALVSSISALISVPISAFVGLHIESTITPLAIAIVVLDILVAIFIFFSWRYSKRFT